MAWTGNFKDQIDDLAGTLAVTDDAAIQQWILDGCYDVLTKAILKSGPEEVWKFVTKSGSVIAVDTDVDEIRTIAGVIRNSVFATKGMWGLKAKYADANSIYAATTNSPMWYLDNDNLSIYPAPTGGEPANYYYVPEYAITNWNTGTSSINSYPSEYYYFAMLYGAIQVLSRRMLDSTVPTSPTFEALPVEPDAIVDAAITFGTLSNQLADISGLTVPTYTSPTTALSAIELFSAFSGTLSNLSISAVPPDVLADLVISATPPTVIGDPTIAYSGTAVPAKADISGDVPTYTKPSTAVIAVTPDAPTLATIAYTGPTTSDVITAPTVSTTAYVLPSAGTAFSSRLADFSALTSFSIVAVAPDEAPAPNIVSPTVDSVTLADITDSLPAYDTQTVLAGTLGNITAQAIADLSITAVPPSAPSIAVVDYTPPVAVTIGAVSGITDIIAISDASAIPITGALSNQPTYLPPVAPDSVALTDELDKMKEYIEDEEDNELSGAKGQEISQRIADFNASLSQYQAELGEANAVYQKDAGIYQALVQQATQNANATNSHAIQNMQKELQRAQSIVQTGSTEHATALQIAQANAANQQAKVMQDAIQQVQDTIANNNALIQEYQANLSVYQAIVGTEVQEYTNNLNKTTQLWSQTNTIILQEHSQRMQNELNNFNEGNARYQANVQAQLAKFQADVADTTKEADLTIQASIQDYTFELQKWSQSLGQYQAEVNTEVQEFTQKLQMELQTWQAEQANAITQYQMETADNMKTADIANQAALAQGQADLQVAVRDKDKELEREIQNATNDMQVIIQNNQSLTAEYQANLAVYQAEVATEMQVIGLDVQNELNEFNKDNARYQANIQAELAKFASDAAEAMQSGNLTLQAAIQDYTLELQAFQAEVTLYQAEVADAVQEYSTNLQKYQAEVSVYQQEAAIQTAEYTQNLQKAVQTWQSEQANRVARYQAEQQDSLGEFNELNAEFQADLQVEIRNAQHKGEFESLKKSKDMEALLADYNSVLQKYQTELTAYGATLAVYQADSASKIQKYQADLQTEGVGYQWLQDQYGRLKMEYEKAFAVAQPQA